MSKVLKVLDFEKVQVFRNVCKDVKTKETVEVNGFEKRGKSYLVFFNDKYMWCQDRKNILLLNQKKTDCLYHFYYKNMSWYNLIKSLSSQYSIDTSKSSIMLYFLWDNQKAIILEHFKVLDEHGKVTFYKTNGASCEQDDIYNITNGKVFKSNVNFNDKSMKNIDKNIVWEYIEDGKLFKWTIARN